MFFNFIGEVSVSDMAKASSLAECLGGGGRIDDADDPDYVDVNDESLLFR